MLKLPYTLEVRIKTLSPENLNTIINRPFCFLLDSAGHEGKKGRYSFFGMDPVRTFSSNEGFITVDGHTFIDNPTDALKRFEASMRDLPCDPYLPFHGGLVGFVGHGWPNYTVDTFDQTVIPDSWFGLYDTILTYDHLEKSCWVSSFGITENGEMSLDLAKQKCEDVLYLLETRPTTLRNNYIIKPLLPDPISDFTEGAYVKAIDAAKKHLHKNEWLRATIAQRFHAPVAINAWAIHKLLRQKNPTPYTSFLRCGNFELLSTSPSCFLQINGDKLICNVVQKSIARNADQAKDKLNQIELLHSSLDSDPVVHDDKNSLRKILTGKPLLRPAHLESDSRSHYLVNRIEGKKARDLQAAACLAAAVPGASMTGVPKTPVNNWIRKTEPARRHVYTGAIGYIGTGQSAQFNMAVRTMIVKDQLAFVHSGQHIDEETNAEEIFFNSKNNINQLFEDIKGLGMEEKNL